MKLSWRKRKTQFCSQLLYFFRLYATVPRVAAMRSMKKRKHKQKLFHYDDDCVWVEIYLPEGANKQGLLINIKDSAPPPIPRASSNESKSSILIIAHCCLSGKFNCFCNPWSEKYITSDVSVAHLEFHDDAIKTEWKLLHMYACETKPSSQFYASNDNVKLLNHMKMLKSFDGKREY